MEKDSMDRRSPERQRHTLYLLRRLSALALFVSLLLVVGPHLLAHFGLIGPSVEERIAEAEGAVRAAESYGAKPDAKEIVAARQELEAARRQAGEGHQAEARAAAARAGAHAREAQAAALVGAGDDERRAHAVVEDLDDQVNELEDMLESLSGRLTREARSAMLKRMRAARKSAAGVFLARDEKRFADALAHEADARRALAETREAFLAAGATRSTPLPSADPSAAPGPSPLASPVGLTLPFESEGACPFECCTYRTWTVERATDVHTARATEGPAAFKLTPGQKVEALTGVVVVSRPGRARAPREVPIEGLGTLRAGDEVEVLHPVGEGFWLVWRDGKKGSAQVGPPPQGKQGGQPELYETAKPTYRWWIQVRDDKGRTGWTDQPDHFGNKDRCA